MSQAEDEIHRQVEQHAHWFNAEGHIVTCRLEVEAAGLAALLGLDVERLHRWRDRHLGPVPSRTVSRVAFYSIAAIVRWQCAQRLGRSVPLDSAPTTHGESASGGSSP